MCEYIPRTWLYLFARSDNRRDRVNRLQLRRERPEVLADARGEQASLRAQILRHAEAMVSGYARDACCFSCVILSHWSRTCFVRAQGYSLSSSARLETSPPSRSQHNPSSHQVRGPGFVYLTPSLPLLVINAASGDFFRNFAWLKKHYPIYVVVSRVQWAV